MGLKSKINKVSCIVDEVLYLYDISLTETIDKLTKFRDSLPKDIQDMVSLDYGIDRDNCVEITCYYKRYETDDEVNLRIKQERDLALSQIEFWTRRLGLGRKRMTNET